MRRFALAFMVCLLAVCAPAAAKANGANSGPAPTGNSGINQYIESIPTDKGNRPTNPVHSGGSRKSGKNHSGGTVGGGGSGGSGGGGTGGGVTGVTSGSSTSGGASNGAISSSTQKKLASHGNDGKAAAAVAISTAPALFGGQGNASGGSFRASGSSTGSDGGSSALGSVVSAFTGSASNGGMGGILPVILIVVLFGSAGMAILRHRRRT